MRRNIHYIMIIGVILIFLVIPLFFIWLFSFSILPWNSSADGLLQYYGTAFSSIATVILGYIAYSQNKRLIKLEEDRERPIVGASLSLIANSTLEEYIKIEGEILFRNERIGRPKWSESPVIQPPDSVSSSGEFSAIQLCISNYGKSVITRIYISYGINHTPRGEKCGANITVSPGQSEYITLVVPRHQVADVVYLSFAIRSSSGAETMATGAILPVTQYNEEEKMLHVCSYRLSFTIEG